MSLPAHYRDLRKRLLIRIGIASCALFAAAAAVVVLLGASMEPSIKAPGQAALRPPPELASASHMILRGASARSNASSLAEALRDLALPEPLEGTAFEVLVQRPAAEQPDGDGAEAATKASQPGVSSSGSLAKLPKGPHLQVGIFAQPANAEELKAKLEAQGFPVYVESRVQVGPFASRKEAEKAREKLKAIGMATVFIAQ